MNWFFLNTLPYSYSINTNQVVENISKTLYDRMDYLRREFTHIGSSIKLNTNQVVENISKTLYDRMDHLRIEFTHTLIASVVGSLKSLVKLFMIAWTF